MCETYSTTLVPIPDFILNDPSCTYYKVDDSYFDGHEAAIDDQGRKCFVIDSCLVPALKALWDAGIITAGCCCGHGRGNGVIGLITHYNGKDAFGESAPYVISEVVADRRRQNDAYYRGLYDGMTCSGHEDIARLVLNDTERSFEPKEIMSYTKLINKIWELSRSQSKDASESISE